MILFWIAATFYLTGGVFAVLYAFEVEDTAKWGIATTLYTILWPLVGAVIAVIAIGHFAVTVCRTTVRRWRLAQSYLRRG